MTAARKPATVVVTERKALVSEASVTVSRVAALVEAIPVINSLRVLVTKLTKARKPIRKRARV